MSQLALENVAGSSRKQVRRNELLALCFSIRGRIPRSVYWAHRLVSYALLFLVISLVESRQPRIESLGLLTLIPLCVAGIAWCVSSICVVVKRFHDMDCPGYFVLLLLIPIVSLIENLFLGFSSGTRGPNEFGPDPRTRQSMGVTSGG